MSILNLQRFFLQDTTAAGDTATTAPAVTDTAEVATEFVDTFATYEDKLAYLASHCDGDHNDVLDFWDQIFWCHTLMDWAFFLCTVAGTFIAGKLLYWISGKVIKKLTERTKTKLDDLLVDMLEEPIVLVVVGIGLYYAYSTFLSYESTHGGVHEFVLASFSAFFTLAVTWAIARTIDALIEEYVVPFTEKSDSELDDQFLPIIRKSLRAIVWILGIIIALQNAGFNITALIASLGVGGLALALAAQDTVKNLFGGIMIFADKPFKMKDRIKIDGHDGFVEEIGIRSTRIRTLEGRLLTIPNATFSDNIVENVTSEPARKVVLNLGLIYDTAPEQIEHAIEILKAITSENDDVEENVMTSFNAFGDFSLGILLIYYIKPGSDILTTQTAVNLKILQSFNAAGLEMAFPTQTVYTIPQNGGGQA